MKRTVNLLACLGVFVIGVVLAQASDGTTPAAPAKPCCGDAKPAAAAAKGTAATKSAAVTRTKVAAGEKFFGAPYACLQYLLYDDGEISLWSADEYEDLPCQDAPYEIFLWTPAGRTAPQSCEAGCEELTFNATAKNDIKLSAKLDSSKRYIDYITSRPRLPKRPARHTWDPKDGLKDLGEMRVDYVVVKDAQDNPILIKLSSGVAEFSKVRFTGFPPTPRTQNRLITIGFEVEKLPDNIKLEELDVLPAYTWKSHPDDPSDLTDNTAFTVDRNGATYYVTTYTSAKKIEQRP
jgi:hypothetical protein